MLGPKVRLRACRCKPLEHNAGSSSRGPGDALKKADGDVSWAAREKEEQLDDMAKARITARMQDYY